MAPAASRPARCWLRVEQRATGSTVAQPRHDLGLAAHKAVLVGLPGALLSSLSTTITSVTVARTSIETRRTKMRRRNAGRPGRGISRRDISARRGAVGVSLHLLSRESTVQGGQTGAAQARAAAQGRPAALAASPARIAQPCESREGPRPQGVHLPVQRKPRMGTFSSPSKLGSTSAAPPGWCSHACARCRGYGRFSPPRTVRRTTRLRHCAGAAGQDALGRQGRLMRSPRRVGCVATAGPAPGRRPRGRSGADRGLRCVAQDVEKVSMKSVFKNVVFCR